MFSGSISGFCRRVALEFIPEGMKTIRYYSGFSKKVENPVAVASLLENKAVCQFNASRIAKEPSRYSNIRKMYL